MKRVDAGRPGVTSPRAQLRRRVLRSHHAILVLLSGLACLGWASAASGAGRLVTLPAAHGLRVTIDTRWVDGQAYRPVRITLAPTTANSSDRVIQAEVQLKYNWRTEYDLGVRQDIVLPAGAPAAEAIIAVPDFVSEDGLRVNFSEDGRELPVLSLSGGFGGRNMQNDGSMPQIVVLTDSPEQFKKAPLSQSPAFSGAFESVQLADGSQIAVPNNVCLRKPSEAPRRWLDYSSVDIIAVDLAIFERLKSQQPEVFRALVDWTAAGGNLCIDGADRKAGALNTIHKLFGLPPDEAKLSEDGGPGWQAPDKSQWGRPVFELQNLEGGRWQGPGGRAGARNDGAPPFVLQQFGHGIIIAHEGAGPLPKSQEEAAWMLNSIGPARSVWSQRFGVSRVRNNDDYWHFLIPGVGQAPVTEFCVLISLFVIGIGPVNYWLLRRAKRLHLLVLTIPASAAVVTVVLFAYAIIADGLTTRVRVRSVTRLDQRSGQAACVARLSYYAGLAPSGGLKFADDTVVLPLEEMPTTIRHGDAPPRRVMRWENDEQRFESGWIASRTPAQYITARSRPTEIGIDVKPGAAGQWTVHNRLGVHIEKLAVKTRDNRLLWATDIAPSGTAQLRTTDMVAVQRDLADAVNEQALRLPPEMSLNRYGGGSIFGLSRSARRRYYGWNNSNMPMASQQTSRLENDLVAVRQAMLTPGSYVALVQSSPEVEHGTKAQEEDSLHVVIGQW